MAGFFDFIKDPIEQGLRGIQRGVQRGFEDVFGITDMARELRRARRRARVPERITTATDEDVTPEDLIRRRRQRSRATAGGRQSTILTGGAGTLLGTASTEPKTLLGL